MNLSLRVSFRGRARSCVRTHAYTYVRTHARTMLCLMLFAIISTLDLIVSTIVEHLRKEIVRRNGRDAEVVAWITSRGRRFETLASLRLARSARNREEEESYLPFAKFPTSGSSPHLAAGTSLPPSLSFLSLLVDCFRFHDLSFHLPHDQSFPSASATLFPPRPSIVLRERISQTSSSIGCTINYTYSPSLPYSSLAPDCSTIDRFPFNPFLVRRTGSKPILVSRVAINQPSARRPRRSAGISSFVRPLDSPGSIGRSYVRSSSTRLAINSAGLPRVSLRALKGPDPPP